jgi:hypothetical protein
MSATVKRNPGTGSVIIEVPAAGSHMGRNGYAKIDRLEITAHANGTLTFNSINSRGYVTNGGMIGVPTGALIDLLKALKKEVAKGLRPKSPGCNSETPP